MPRKIGPTIFELLSLDEFVIGYGGWTNVIGSSVSNHVKVRESYGGLAGDVDLGIGSNDILELDLNGRFNYNVSGVEHLRAGADNRTQVFLQNQNAVTLETDGSLYKLVGGIGDDVFTVTGNRGTGTDFAIDLDDNVVQLGAGDDTLILHDKDGTDNGADAADLNAVNRTGLDHYDGGLGDDLLIIHKEATITTDVQYQFLDDADLTGFETLRLENLTASGVLDVDVTGQTEVMVIEASTNDDLIRLGAETNATAGATTNPAPGDGTGYKIITGFEGDGPDKLWVEPSANYDRDNASNRLMFDYAEHNQNKTLAAGTELLLVVDGGSLSDQHVTSGDLAASLNSAFRTEELANGDVIFSIRADQDTYWVGHYDHGGGAATAADITILARVDTDGEPVSEDSFWKVGALAPQSAHSVSISDSGNSSSDDYTNDDTVSVTNIQAGAYTGNSYNIQPQDISDLGIRYEIPNQDGRPSAGTDSGSSSSSGGSDVINLTGADDPTRYTRIEVFTMDAFGNEGGTSVDIGDHDIDTVAPSPTISDIDNIGTGTSGSFTVNFGEAVWNVSKSDFSAPSNVTIDSVLHSNEDSTATVSYSAAADFEQTGKKISLNADGYQDGAGNAGGSASSAAFSIDTAQSAATSLDISGPTGFKPSASTSSDDYTFGWTAPSTDIASVSYDLYLTKDTGSVQLAASNLSTEEYKTGLTDAGDYQWYVVSEDSFGNTATSGTDSFSVVVPDTTDPIFGDNSEVYGDGGNLGTATATEGSSTPFSYVHWVDVNKTHQLIFDFDDEDDDGVSTTPTVNNWVANYDIHGNTPEDTSTSGLTKGTGANDSIVTLDLDEMVTKMGSFGGTGADFRLQVLFDVTDDAGNRLTGVNDSTAAGNTSWKGSLPSWAAGKSQSDFYTYIAYVDLDGL